MAGLELLSDEGLRLDGRIPHELRKIQCRVNVFNQADGSAYIEQGNTKVLAAVYGPHEAYNRSKALHDRAIINCQYSMATFSTGERKRRPHGDRISQLMAVQIKETFEAAIQTELYPRSQIDIYVEILQSGGGNYRVFVYAATLALVDAGIPLRDYVCACTGGIINETPIIDISYIEESMNGPGVMVTMLPKSEQIIRLSIDARIHTDHHSKVLDIAKTGCKDVYAVMEHVVHNHVADVTSHLFNLIGGGNNNMHKNINKILYL